MPQNMHALVDILIGTALRIRLISLPSQIHLMLEPDREQSKIPRIDWDWPLVLDIAPYAIFAIILIILMIFLP